MADLGSRLLEAGLVTRAQLSRALEAAPPHGAALARELVRLGVEEDAIAGYFVAAGFGPLVSASELRDAEPGAVRELAAPIARALLAIPLRRAPGGLVVAMVAPSDEHALSEIELAVTQPVVPLVARLGELSAALDALSRDMPDEPLVEVEVDVDVDSDVHPMPLVRPRTPPGAVPELPGVPRRRRTADFAAAEHEEPPVRRRRRTADFEPNRESARRRRRTADFEAPQEGRDFEPPAERRKRRPSFDRWDLPPPLPVEPRIVQLDAPPPPPRLRRSLRPPPAGAAPEASDIGALLAAIRVSRSRDEVVKLACEAAATVGRCAVVLGMQRGILRGIAAHGGGLGPAGVKNLRIPKRAESLFRDVVDRCEEYFGPHGSAAADITFRATIGARGGDVLLVPIVLSGKTAAVLCVDEVQHGERGRERAEVVAHAAGEAFERIIRVGKTGS